MMVDRFITDIMVQEVQLVHIKCAKTVFKVIIDPDPIHVTLLTQLPFLVPCHHLEL